MVNSQAEILENLPDPLIAVDRRWRISYVNRAAAGLLNRSRGEAIGAVLWEAYPQREGSQFERELRRAYEQTEAVEFEVPAMQPGRWYAIRAYWVDGGLAISFQDITRRRRRAAAHRQNSELGRLVQLAAVVANEAEEPIAAFNEVARRICGSTDWEVGNVLLPSADDPRTVKLHESWCYQAPTQMLDRFRALTEAMRFEPGVGLPGRVLKTGAPAWIRDLAQDAASPRAAAAKAVGLHSAVAFPVRVGASIVAVIEFFSRSEIEPDRRMNRTLETIGMQLGRVVERYESMQLVERAMAEAERANEAKTQFISRMSHELRTPMNAILGFAQLLEMEGPRPDQKESVEQILKGGRHLLLLINEVLDITRIEAGRLAISPEPVDTAEVLDQCLSLVTPLAAARQIQLARSLPPRGCYVRADRQRLVQVVLNLLSNAIKYNRVDGEVATEVEQRGPSVRIKVRDTGPGVAPERRSLLFQPFERLGADRSTVEGTGLGLALSKAYVEMMGGRIGLDSPPSGGSVFWIELQTESAQFVLEEPADDGDLRRGPAEDGGSRHSVLYIEDNLSNVKLIQRILRRRPNVKLLSAMQGSMGLELAAQHRPSLILLDFNLPDLSGEEILLRLQAEPSTRDIPVLVISADASEHQTKRMKAAGAYDYMTKPIDVAKLLEVFDRLLVGSPARV